MANNIGFYKGIPIIAGTDAEIAAQMAKIDGNPANTGATSSTIGGQPTSYYGYARTPAAENANLQQEKFIESAAINANIISPNFLASEITSHPDLVAFYINAMTYGGYTTGDVLNDMKRRELISQGNPQAKAMKPIIDPNQPRATYQASADGQQSVRETASIIPTFNLQGVMDPNILKYGSNMPDDLFKTIVPLQDKDSQEFKDAVANIKSAFTDLANQQLQATSEQEKAIADYNYSQFKKQIERQYGIALSDDAVKAWKQIEDLENGFGTRGLSGSGLQNEAIDDALRTTRTQDQRLRQDKLTKEQQQMAATYTSSATPAQIQALIAEDQAKGLPKDQWRATQWGLVPSDDILAQYDLSALKARYPNSTEAELKAKRDAVLDENGNYRSTIYQKYYSGVDANNVAQKATAESTVYQASLDAEAKAKRDYDNSQVLNIQGGTGSAPVATPSTNQNVTPPANYTGIADDPSHKYNELTGQLNPNYKPPVTQTTPVVKTPTQKPVVPNTSSSGYKIAYGDTLSALALKNNTTVSALAKLNNISDPNKIKAGQTIKFQ